MRNMFIYYILMLALVGCFNKNRSSEIEPKLSPTKQTNNLIGKDTLFINSENLERQVIGGTRLYKGELFTGYGIKYYKNNQLAEKTFYVNGKREGTAKYWFDNGKLKKTIDYKNNKLEGSSIAYFFNGKKSSIKNYSENRLHGIQERWYRNGQMFKRQNYTKGKENGLQEAWMENGKKFINYEARNGRIFGLKRINLCFGLENENIKE